MSTLVSRPCCKSVWQVTSLVFPVCVTNLYSRQCDKFSFRVCVQILFSPLCYKLSFLVCVSDLVFSSVWRIWFSRLCDKSYASGCVPRSYRGLCDQFTFHFRVFYDRYSLLRLHLRDEWRDVTSLCDKSVWQMLWTRPFAGFVLSGSVWPIYFPFWRVYDSYSSWHCVWGFDLCLHVWRFLVLCDLRLCTNVMNASLVITLECLVLGRVVNKWSVSLVPLVILP